MRCLLMLLCLGLAAGPCATARAQAPATVVEVDLRAELGHVSLRQVEIIRILIRVAQIMEELYQQQLAADGFYPADMERQEFEAWADPAAAHPHMRVRRDPEGRLEAVPYHEAWPVALGRAARLLARAAEVTNDEALRNYLTLRARALITGDHARADAAWRGMRHSEVDVLIGPIGRDADRDYGLKAGFGAYVLLRDWAWGARLARFTVFLPQMQHDLPVSAAFKSQVPNVDLNLGVYDLLYQAGSGAARVDSVAPENAGDPRVRLQNGPRRLQLRNVMRARFDKLVLPVADTLVVPEQRALADFDAFFINTMLHEMAHSLGLSRTIDDRATVSAALREHADTIEETKAAVLSLWVVDWLHAHDELPDTTRMAHYVSFLASIFRTIKLDAYSPAGQARLLLFNYFRDWGAFRRDAETGLYRIEEADMGRAIEALAAHVLTLQGSGDHAGAAGLIDTMAVARTEFRADLERLAAAGIPATIVFRQGEHLLGL
jgi:hypothetical protein